MDEKLQSRMTSKGQVTIPSTYRREMKLSPGDTFVFGRDDEGITLRVRRSRLRDGLGAAGKLPRPLTDSEMEDAFEQGVADDVIASMQNAGRLDS